MSSRQIANSTNLSRDAPSLKYRHESGLLEAAAVSGVSFPPWGPRAPVNTLSSPAIELAATRHGLWNLLNYDNALSGGLARRTDGKVLAAVNSAVTGRKSDGRARRVCRQMAREAPFIGARHTRDLSLGWLTADVRAIPGSCDLQEQF